MAYGLSQHIHDVWACVYVLEAGVWSAQPYCPACCVFEAYSLLSPTPLSVLWAVCCGAVTSLSPRCHPAGAGFRRARPLPKPHSATSAIHKRQPLSLSLLPRPHRLRLTLLHFSLSLCLSPTNFLFWFPNSMHPPFFFWIPSTASSHHFWFSSCWTSTGSSPISHSLTAPFLSFRFFIHIQRKNLSPIISSVGANWVWWQWTGNHKTFLIQTALSHQRSRLLTVACAKHTLHLSTGFSLTTSQLVPKQRNVYLFQIDSVREKKC